MQDRRPLARGAGRPPAGHTAEPSARTGREAPDLGRSAVPRYLQLASLFRRRIAQGAWKVGNRIPTVLELAAEWSVSTATIRQALDEVEGEGLIERFRAKGTFVRATPGDRVWHTVETDWNGLLRLQEGEEIEVLSDDAGGNGAVPPVMVGEAAPRYRHLRRRYWRGDQPFLVADLWLDDRLSPHVAPLDLRSKTALNLLASIRGVRIVDARQVLTVWSADPETAASLALPLNAPVVHVQRTVVDAHGVLLMVADGFYRGDVVRLEIRLK